MFLQEKKWEFVFSDNKRVQYDKKEHRCVDGFIKDSKEVVFLLDGLVRDGQRHANIKNYVIPYADD